MAWSPWSCANVRRPPGADRWRPAASRTKNVASSRPVGRQDPRHLAEVAVRLVGQQVGEDGRGEGEVEGRVRRTGRCTRGPAHPRRAGRGRCAHPPPGSGSAGGPRSAAGTRRCPRARRRSPRRRRAAAEVAGQRPRHPADAAARRRALARRASARPARRTAPGTRRPSTGSRCRRRSRAGAAGGTSGSRWRTASTASIAAQAQRLHGPSDHARQPTRPGAARAAHQAGSGRVADDRRDRRVHPRRAAPMAGR